ncbi:MAG: hypothetical protein AAF703_04715 [Cyanobacteria bacterium P01_D01_bin.105]
MKGFKLSALFSAVVCSLPMAAIAQTSSTDSAYLSDLYSFLQSEDNITYTMATQSMTPEDSVWAAQMFCNTFASGVTPEDAYEVYTTAAIGQGEAYGGAFTEEIAYAVGLYGGAVMNLGAAYYCPQYQPQVQQALSAL